MYENSGFGMSFEFQKMRTWAWMREKRREFDKYTLLDALYEIQLDRKSALV